MNGYLFTSSCSLQSQVDPVAEFQFYITQNFSGAINPLSNYTEVNVSVISETRQSIRVKLNGNFIFPESGIIQVNCTVSNSNGKDSVTTSVRLCGKDQLIT